MFENSFTYEYIKKIMIMYIFNHIFAVRIFEGEIFSSSKSHSPSQHDGKNFRKMGLWNSYEKSESRLQ